MRTCTRNCWPRIALARRPTAAEAAAKVAAAQATAGVLAEDMDAAEAVEADSVEE